MSYSYIHDDFISLKAQKISLYELEMVHSSVLSQFDQFWRPWRKRVNAGGIVTNFRDRSDALLHKICQEFLIKTASCNLAKQRSNKLTLLEKMIENSQQILFRLQQDVLERKARLDIKNRLIAILARNGSYPEDTRDLLSVVLKQLNISLSSLRPLHLDTDWAASFGQVVDRMTRYCNSFPESPEGQLEVIQLSDQIIRKKNKISSDGSENSNNSLRRQLSVKFGLGLVGMVRPPGFGNLQGKKPSTL
jgi:hypothetical protein